MLQTIHEQKGSAPASSIYCQWIRMGRGEQSALVAVWIDSKMRCYERDFALNSEAELLPEGALDEPGGASAVHSLKQQTMTTEITLHRS